ncbi:sensor domain-containing protein (plasmid) [Mycolicibacterium aichiense]|uniref:sensor domain-containing protein n=1 Tax=Mycolicibacterium aichiense TaxID=1799 RepID=UPI003D66ABDF
MTLRVAAAATVLSTAVASCSVSTAGHGVGAETLGHAPKPVAAAALSDLLLGISEAGSVMGAKLSVVSSGHELNENKPLDDGCLVWSEAQRRNYDGSDWTAVREVEMRDRPDNSDNIVYEAVVAFTDAAAAHEFYASQKVEWARCDDRRVDLHDAGDPSSHYWTLSRATEDQGVLTLTRSEEEDPGWSCQHAMTVKNNVVVDVSACAMNVADRGAELVQRIAAKVNDQ